jgi:hypothetical protein
MDLPSSPRPTPTLAAPETFLGTSAKPKVITDDDVRRVAEKHDVCDRSVVRVLAGLDVAGRAGERARRAAAELRRGG